jgi:hypothetical protein
MSARNGVPAAAAACALLGAAGVTRMHRPRGRPSQALRGRVHLGLQLGLQLSLGANPSAVHVAIVTDDPPGQRGPDVVNGDGTGPASPSSRSGTSQVRADAGHHDSTLASYVSPP